MSSRALRRLHGDSSLAELARNSNDDNDINDIDEDERDLSEDGFRTSHGEAQNAMKNSRKNKKKHQKKVLDNPFELLNEGNDEEINTDSKEEESQDASVSQGAEKDGDVESGGHGEIRTKKKKKKNRKKGKEKENEHLHSSSMQKEPEDEIEASLQEVNRILGDPGIAISQDVDCSIRFSANMKPLLHIDYRNLNPENELKRMFGSQVIREQQQNQRNRRQRNRPVQRSSRLVQPKDTWHHTGGSGLSMKYLGEEEGFAFEHSPAYQKIQHQFCDAVESGHPENILTILHDNPYHIDSLIQMAELHRTNEDVQTAAESIEKALYGMECAFHPVFNLASGNCHLSYKRPENRAFFLCLFKHIINLGRRGCPRTAFEFCKVLLSLDPINDPLDCLSMIDFYALRSEQYDHLLQLEREVMTYENMKQVPNFAMSIPLAHFKIASKDGKETTEADLMLQDKLMFFPMMLLPLLDQCSVQPDKRVSSHPFFSTSELNDSSSELRRLITMYVKRCEPCWKETEVMTWLERNVTAVLDIVDKKTDKRPQEYAKMRGQRFKHPPYSLLRHYFLSEIQELGLPRAYVTTSILGHDPFPPPDSIISYTRPPRQTVASQDRGGVLRSLLQSLLPSYNPYEPADERMRRQRQNREREDNDDGENDDGAGGARAIPHQIHQSVNAVMNAMRQLLNDPFAVAPQLDVGDGNLQNQEEAQENEREWEEEEDDFQNNRR